MNCQENRPLDNLGGERMKVASVEWKKSEWKKIDKPKSLIYKIKECLLGVFISS